jgi:dTDP-4-amino-4,6-dideoxyglucose formyltransferase
MKRLLVVSENVNLCQFLKSEICAQGLSTEWDTDFRYTSYNNDPKSMVEFGAKEINIKMSKTVNYIIENYDIVFSLHCKQIFPASLVEKTPCFNFHPGFNPYNRGWYPQSFSIINGLPIGATIHRMDADIDHGGIVAQQEVSIAPEDSSLNVYDKVIEAEKKLMKKHLLAILSDNVTLSSPKEEGNYNSIRDYKALCELDLENTSTLRSHINLLRALTHGEFRNAYFVEGGKKYFVKISISD